jgi:hypothetical protein
MFLKTTQCVPQDNTVCSSRQLSVSLTSGKSIALKYEILPRKHSHPSKNFPAQEEQGVQGNALTDGVQACPESKTTNIRGKDVLQEALTKPFYCIGQTSCKFVLKISLYSSTE